MSEIEIIQYLFSRYFAQIQVLRENAQKLYAQKFLGKTFFIKALIKLSNTFL